MKRVSLAIFLSFTMIGGIGMLTPPPTWAVYPDKVVNLIVVFPPGGICDIVGRSITEGAKKYFPKPFAVINRAGAAGTIGAAEVIQAKPDGYTIGISGSGVLTIQPHRTKLPYGSPEDYTPIIKLITSPSCLVVKSNAPWKTIQEFMDYAKANPGKIRVAHSGQGTSVHLNIEQLKALAKIDLTAVPFSGSGEVIPALLGGHVEAGAMIPQEIAAQVQAGKARVLAVFEDKRNHLFPNAPTFKEIGYDLTFSVYQMIFGPKGLPPQIVTTLHDALKKGMDDPIFKDTMGKQGEIISYEGPADLKKHLMEDYKLNAKFSEFLK